MENNETKILKPKDIQKILRIGKNKTMDIFHRDDFPCYKIVKNFYIVEEHFTEWLKK